MTAAFWTSFAHCSATVQCIVHQCNLHIFFAQHSTVYNEHPLNWSWLVILLLLYIYELIYEMIKQCYEVWTEHEVTQLTTDHSNHTVETLQSHISIFFFKCIVKSFCKEVCTLLLYLLLYQMIGTTHLICLMSSPGVMSRTWAWHQMQCWFWRQVNLLDI